MSVEISYRAVCDSCGTAGPISLRGILDAESQARKKQWGEEMVHQCGLTLNFCPVCYKAVGTCKVCEKRTYDPRAALCGSCGWRGKA